MATEASAEAMATVADKAQVTAERKVRNDLETKLPKPCEWKLKLRFISILSNVIETKWNDINQVSAQIQIHL